jgi:Leucine-rich repeat (LRR) protein
MKKINNRFGRTVALVVACALMSTVALALTPGSMLGVCYSDGQCVSIEGAEFGAAVERIRAAGRIDAVRQVGLRQFRGKVLMVDIVRAFPRLEKLEFEYRGDLADLAALDGFAPLRELTVVRVPQTAIEAIVKLRQLEKLDLREGNFTRLTGFGAMAGLKRLDLNGAAVDSLADLETARLTELELARTRVTNLGPLKEMTSLRKLGLNQTRVADLAPLARLQGLEELYAAQTAVASLAPLAGLPALTVLDVNKTAVADVKALAGASRLRDLNLAQTRVRSLAPIRSLRSLAFLDLSKGALPAAELVAFAQALPDCKINLW